MPESRRTQTQPKEREILQSPAQPLLSIDRRIVLFFSAKAGCTFAIKWFLDQADMLTAARYYHPWIHNFRRDVLYRSREHERALREYFLHGFRVVKVVRNPYARAASSYVHANLTGYADRDMGSFLGRPVDRKRRFSFAEFVDYLSSIDVRSTNVHHRTQTHRAERADLVEVDHVVHLENSMQALPEVESALGVAHSDLAALRGSVHHTNRSTDHRFCGTEALVLSKDEAIPPTRAFYDSTLKSAVAEIYAEDFRRYGYDTDQLP